MTGPNKGVVAFFRMTLMASESRSPQARVVLSACFMEFEALGYKRSNFSQKGKNTCDSVKFVMRPAEDDGWVSPELYSAIIRTVACAAWREYVAARLDM